MSRIFTGGTGLLGQEIQKYFPDDYFPSSKEFDITDLEKIESYFLSNRQPSEIVHMAAETDTVNIEKHDHFRLKALRTNIVGTANLVEFCMQRNIKLTYISTDYVFDGNKGDYNESDPLMPINKYAWSKLGGEACVRMLENSLIIRTSFCSDRFPYPKAFIDQYTTRLPVSELATKLKDMLNNNITGIRHLYGDKVTVFELARRISPKKNIQPMSINDLDGYTVPKDTSLTTNVKEDT